MIRRPAIVSALLAPVFLIGGTITAELLWTDFDPVTQTISELAAGDAPTRVLMTVAFVLTGLCHIVTGTFAVGIGRPGRIALMVAGVATLGVAAFPLPTVATSSLGHSITAVTAFTALAVWPALGMRRSRDLPWVVRPVGASFSTIVLLGLCAWFFVVNSLEGFGPSGVPERALAYIEALWPAIVVLSVVASSRRAKLGTPGT
jgi:hypothetical membrane protein